jgi:hypothetical protein
VSLPFAPSWRPPQTQFDLIAKPAMKDDVLKLMRHHLRGRNDIADPMIQQLATRFGSGLGFQLRSLPVAMRVDQDIFDNHPPLRDLQRKSIELQLQENMYALSPSVKSVAPDKIVRPNASMNTAFAKFFSDLWDDPTVFAPYIAAGYSKVTQELLEIIPIADALEKLLTIPNGNGLPLVISKFTSLQSQRRFSLQVTMQPGQLPPATDPQSAPKKSNPSK